MYEDDNMRRYYGGDQRLLVIDAKIDYERLVKSLSSCMRIDLRCTHIYIYMNEC